MKKIISLLTILIVVTACSKENENDTTFTTSDLEGTWSVVELQSEEAKLSGIPFLSGNLDITGKDYNMTVTFSENPKQITSQGSLIAVIKISSQLTGGEELEQKITKIPATNGDWKIENGKLITEYQGQTTSVTIISQSKSEIILSYPLNEGIGESIAIPELKEAELSGTLTVKLTKN